MKVDISIKNGTCDGEHGLVTAVDVEDVSVADKMIIMHSLRTALEMDDHEFEVYLMAEAMDVFSKVSEIIDKNREVHYEG